MRERGGFSLNFYFLFSLFMILLYAVAGIILIFVWPPQDMLPDLNRIGLGIVLLGYSVYRVFRLQKKEKGKRNAVTHHE